MGLDEVQAAYDEALRRVLADVAATTPLRPDIAVDFTEEMPYRFEDRHWSSLLRTEDPEEAAVQLADHVQDDVLEELWGPAWPPCPMGHPHPAKAELVAGRAGWTCPKPGPIVQGIGIGWLRDRPRSDTAPPEDGQNYRSDATEPYPWDPRWEDGWTEVVRSDDTVDPAGGAEPLGPLDPTADVIRRLLQEPLRERGVNVDDLDLSTDVHIHRFIKQTGRFVHRGYAVAVRTERLPGAR